MASQKRRDGEEPAPDESKKKDESAKVDADVEMMPKKDADEAYAAMEAKHAAEMGALKSMLQDALSKIAKLESEESAEITDADVPEAVADSIIEKRLARLDSAREGARLIAPAAKLDGLLKPRAIHEAAVKAASPSVKLDGLSDERVAGMFEILVDSARAKQTKRADGNARVAATLGTTTTQAEEVAREDGNKAVDPLALQREALASWGTRDNTNTANGSAR